MKRVYISFPTWILTSQLICPLLVSYVIVNLINSFAFGKILFVSQIHRITPKQSLFIHHQSFVSRLSKNHGHWDDSTGSSRPTNKCKNSLLRNDTEKRYFPSFCRETNISRRRAHQFARNYKVRNVIYTLLINFPRPRDGILDALRDVWIEN